MAQTEKATGVNHDSRSKNSLRNVGTSILGQLLNNLLRFICRTAFIYTLGQEYLGISSLYSNVLQILNIAELGFSTAITYSLYRPLAENDIDEICSLMLFFKKVYRIIGAVIFAVGLCLMPALPYLMTGVTNKVNIYLYYMLYLVQTVVSYLFFAYKAVLLTADQKKYLADIVQYISQIAMNGVQIIILLTLRSFLLYTITAIVFAIVQNIATAAVVDRKYPYLKRKAKPLSAAERKIVYKRVYATALYKVSTAVGVATDNLIISKFLGVVVVGIYENYNLIVQTVQTAITGVIRSFSASLGNLYVLESEKRNEFIFRALNFLNCFIVVFCSVEFLAVFQPFIRMWAGEKYLLSETVLWIIVYNFATNYMELVVNIYNESAGTFVRGKYRAVFTAVINLVVSIILVKIMGLPGVFLGSIIARMVTIWWYDATLLYHHAFHMPVRKYFLTYFIHIGLIAVFGIALHFVSLPVRHAANPVRFFYRGIMALIMVVGVYWLLFHRSEEYKYLMEKMRAFLHKRKGHKKK